MSRSMLTTEPGYCVIWFDRSLYISISSYDDALANTGSQTKVINGCNMMPTLFSIKGGSAHVVFDGYYT